jgi:hypothetical protein
MVQMRGAIRSLTGQCQRQQKGSEEVFDPLLERKEGLYFARKKIGTL